MNANVHRLRGALAAALLALAGTAHALVGSGTPVTQQREVSGFSGVGLSVPGKLEIVQGEAEGLRVTVDDNLAAELETAVVKGTLRIRWRDDKDHRPKTPIRITLNARTMRSISVAGSGSVAAPALATPRLEVRVAGSGEARLGGRTEDLEVRIAGSGDVDAARLDAQRARVRVAGSGDATVAARESLAVTVAGSGAVRYYGDPAVERRIAGSGSVRRVGAAPG